MSPRSPRRTLLVGGSSQLVPPLAERLAADGDELHVFSRHPAGRSLGLGEQWHDWSLLRDMLDSADVVFFLAPLPAVVAWLADQHCALPPRVIALSTTSVLAKRNASDPAERMYASRLLQAEGELEERCRRDGSALTVLRPTLVYGGGREDLVERIARFMKRFRLFPVVGGGHGKRAPVHVDDIAEACVNAARRATTPQRAYVLSGGTTLTFREMVMAIARARRIRFQLVRVPQWPLARLFGLVRRIPRFGYLTPGMADRMNQDQDFEHAAATRDLDFHPRGFEPGESKEVMR